MLGEKVSTSNPMSWTPYPLISCWGPLNSRWFFPNSLKLLNGRLAIFSVSEFLALIMLQNSLPGLQMSSRPFIVGSTGLGILSSAQFSMRWHHSFNTFSTDWIQQRVFRQFPPEVFSILPRCSPSFLLLLPHFLCPREDLLGFIHYEVLLVYLV